MFAWNLMWEQCVADLDCFTNFLSTEFLRKKVKVWKYIDMMVLQRCFAKAWLFKLKLYCLFCTGVQQGWWHILGGGVRSGGGARGRCSHSAAGAGTRQSPEGRDPLWIPPPGRLSSCCWSRHSPESRRMRLFIEYLLQLGSHPAAGAGTRQSPEGRDPLWIPPPGSFSSSCWSRHSPESRRTRPSMNISSR